MPAKNVIDSDLARFFAAFHEVYPHSLPRKTRLQIWSIARRLFDGDIAIQQALVMAGIPPDVHEADLKDADRKLAKFFALLVALIVLLGVGYGIGANAAHRQPSKPERSPDPATKQRVFHQLFENLEENEEPDEWIPAPGPPVPVLSQGSQRQTSAPNPQRSQALVRQQTSAEPKPKRGERAKASNKKSKK